MRILVCGSRTWTDGQRIYEALKRFLHEDVLVIDGGANGADKLGHEAALGLGFRTVRFHANWHKYGRRAGVLRNEKMLNEGQPDLVMAFWDGASRSTAHMIDISKRAGVRVEVFT